MAARKKKKGKFVGPNKSSSLANQMIGELQKGRRRSNDVRIWETRLRMGMRHSADFYREFSENMDFFRGLQALTGYDFQNSHILDNLEPYIRSGRVVWVNRIMAAIAAQNASLMWRYPWHHLIARRATSPEGDLARETGEHTLNYILQNPRNNWLQKARLMITSSELGMGVMKATYTPHEGIPEEKHGEVLGEIVVQEIDGREVVGFVGGPPRRDDDGNPIIKRGNRYVVETRNPADIWKSQFVFLQDMLFDPEGANDMQDHGWTAQRMSWSANEIEENELFDYKSEILDFARFADTEELSENTRKYFGGSRPAPGDGYEPGDVDKDVMRIWGWQLWDAKKREVLYMVDGFHKLIGKVNYPRYIQTFPYSVSKLHEVPGEFWPVSEISQVRPLAKAYNEMMTMQLTHARRYTRWYIAKEGMFSTNNKNIARDNEDGRVAEYRKGFNVADFLPVQDAPLDPMVYRLTNKFVDDFSEVMGSSPEARSVADSETATQAAIVENRTTSRDNDKRAQIACALKHHAKVMMDMIQATMDRSIAVEIRGSEGEYFERVVTQAQIQGDFDVQIDLKDLEPHDSMTERRDLNEILQILGPVAFAAPSFGRRFWSARRVYDPQLARELQQLGEMMLQSQAGGGGQQGGPSPAREGREEGRTEAGRSAGRQNRTAAGAGERGRAA